LLGGLAGSSGEKIGRILLSSKLLDVFFQFRQSFFQILDNILFHFISFHDNHWQSYGKLHEKALGKPGKWLPGVKI
jgi:hypothetical protein